MTHKYKLPHEIYHEAQWAVRAYRWQKAEYESALQKAHLMDGQPRGTQISDPTYSATLQRLKYHDEVMAVEKAISKIPEEYVKGILEAIYWRRPYPNYAAVSTWKRWRQRLIYWVAFYKGWI